MKTLKRTDLPRRAGLQKELKQIEAELARLTTAIAAGGTWQTVLAAVQERESRRTQVQCNWRCSAAIVTPFDAERTEDELRSYEDLKDHRRLSLE